MNFKIDCNVLLDNLNTIQKGLPIKTPMPILTGIKIDIYNNYLNLTSTNLDISIQVKIEDSSLVVKQQGKVIIPGKYFIEIIRKINSKNVEISLIDDKLLLIKAERLEFKLNIMDYSDYPDISFIKTNDCFDLNANIIKGIIKEINFTASTSEKRPILTGVNLKLENNILYCIATDSFRLSKKIIYLDQTITDFNIVIPNKSLEELSKIIEDYQKDVNICIQNNKILFNLKNIQYQSRLLEGNYPDTSRLIPSEFPVIIKFHKDDLLLAIERVSLLSPKEKDRNFNIVLLSVLNKLAVKVTSTNNEIGDAMEEIVLNEEINGPIIKIAFSSKYLIDALKAFVSNEVTLNFTGELKPFIIKGEKDQNLIHLILPVKLD